MCSRPDNGAIVNEGALIPGHEPERDEALVAARDHAVLAAALDPIITIDANAIIQSASDSVHRVFGWTPAELVGRNVNVLMPEPHHSAHDGYLENYRRTGKTNILGRTREFECVRRDGEVFPIELSVSRVDTPGGGLPLFVGLIRDVSERVRLERELRLIQDLTLSISSAATLHAALVEALRLICTATEWDYAEAWLPSPADDELVGVASWLSPNSGLERFAASMAETRLARGVGLAGRAWASARPIWIGDVMTLKEAEFRRPDLARDAGLRAASAVPVRSGNDTIAILVFFVRRTRREDLHLLELVRAAVSPLGTLIRRKQAEDELDEYRRRLEERVEQRTRALAESQDKLRLADRLASIGTLAAGLGHDMNNVLLPVRAHLNALLAGLADAPDSRRHVNEIAKSVSYLQQLADGLHFLAMDPDSADTQGAEATDLRQWWAQAGVLISKAVPQHVRVTASFPTDLPQVGVVAHALTQAVLNLVVNAGEAIPPDSKRKGRVRVWARVDPDARTVSLGVTDNGTGMTDEVKRRAFEMFFTSKSRGMGTGLGLALVNRVAVSAGGRVDLESVEGRGTTVAIILNAIDERHDTPSPVAVVSVTDGRCAALIRHLLETAGARAGERPAGADIWVADPVETDLREAKLWRDARADACLVLFGVPDSASASAWSALRPVIIERRDDFEALKEGLGRALAEF
jgi:PAS domain S-box-containing protein